MRTYLLRSGLCLLLGAAALGCSEPSPDQPPGEADLSSQKPPEGACDARAPRPLAPELFVGPMGLEARLLGKMDQAKKSLDLLMYEMSQPSFVDKAIELHKRGVAVRIVLDAGRGADYDEPKKRLTDAGVPVKGSPARFSYYHVKAMIIDGVEAVIMSANMDIFSMDRARNYGVVDRDPEDLRALQSIVEADWGGQKDPDLSCTRLVVSPVNSLDRLRGLMASAEKSLDLQLMYLSESNMVDTVKSKAQAGLPVRILLATDNFVKGNAMQAQALLTAGAQVKFFYSNHAKLILSDGVAYVGSENMSWTSLTKNREVGVFVSEPASAAVARAQFEADWKAGVAVMPQ